MSERISIAIIDHFQDLPDPRQQGKVLYPLAEIILAALCAILCGADCYVEIAEFGKAKIDFLKRFYPSNWGFRVMIPLKLFSLLLTRYYLTKYLFPGFNRFRILFQNLLLLMVKPSDDQLMETRSLYMWFQPRRPCNVWLWDR
ncbi:MAG: transposase family protein [Desulfovibrio sp.]|jgi:hypothetical protein|nr:transposase family protein [Desulfovibrio sp.]